MRTRLPLPAALPAGVLAGVLVGCAPSADPEPVAVPPAGHGGSVVDTDAERACVAAGRARDLVAGELTGSSSVTLAQVRSAAGAAAALEAGPYGALPSTHPVTACFFFDGRRYVSLLVDAEGRTDLNPAAPQG